MAPDAMGPQEPLQRDGWPMNLRELRIEIECAVILRPSPLLKVGAYPERIAARPAVGAQIGGRNTRWMKSSEATLRA